MTFLAALLAFAFASCDSVGTSLSGTNWQYDAGLGSGVGLKFTSETAGTTTLGLLGTWSSVLSFTYTYTPSTKTGTISYISGLDSTPFTVVGNTLTYAGTDYTYKP